MSDVLLDILDRTLTLTVPRNAHSSTPGALIEVLLGVVVRQLNLDVLLLGLSLHLLSEHAFEGVPLLPALFQPLCFYVGHPARSWGIIQWMLFSPWQALGSSKSQVEKLRAKFLRVPS